MTLSPGTRLGVYEITALIGAGGMGEVYRARDSRLNRQVALKVLPDAFAADPDRLARFTREAQLLASLNHPNITAIYGVEEQNVVSGFSRTLQALVLELVEGPTLADRIAESPIPADEALLIAEQIAEALQAAHEQGVIHRDLKPASIKPIGLARVRSHRTGRGSPSLVCSAVLAMYTSVRSTSSRQPQSGAATTRRQDSSRPTARPLRLPNRRRAQNDPSVRWDYDDGDGRGQLYVWGGLGCRRSLCIRPRRSAVAGALRRGRAEGADEKTAAYEGGARVSPDGT